MARVSRGNAGRGLGLDAYDTTVGQFDDQIDLMAPVNEENKDMSFKIGALAVMLALGGAPGILGGSASAATPEGHVGVPVPAVQQYLECGLAPGPCTPGCIQEGDGSNCAGTQSDAPPVERKHKAKLKSTTKSAPDHRNRHNPGRRPVN
jgi:hypothetical protein